MSHLVNSEWKAEGVEEQTVGKAEIVEIVDFQTAKNSLMMVGMNSVNSIRGNNSSKIMRDLDNKMSSLNFQEGYLKIIVGQILSSQSQGDFSLKLGDT